MDENNILPIMIKDHCKIEKLLDDLEENCENDFVKMRKCFHKFEWELEKHIFTEEKAIFTSYSPADIKEGYKMLPELTSQHNYIVNQLNNWREEIKTQKKISGIYDFKIFLSKHRIYEEKEVYPKLDKSLTEEEKQHIISKINEIV